jgi:3'-5' exoribonuclease
MVSDLRLKTSGVVKGTFLISKVEMKPFNNKPGNFMSCELSDKSGNLKAILWDGVGLYESWLRNGLVVDIVGTMATYKDSPQLVLTTLAQCSSYDISQFIPSLDKSKVNDIMKNLDTLSQAIKNPVCKIIWNAILKSEDADLIEKFKTCPGGKGDVHHAYLGGLAEHSESMVKIGARLASAMGLDADILMTGCLIHDIGKIAAYQWETGIDMNDAGRLLHHTTLGYDMLQRLATIYNIPRSDITLLKLSHIIISHHDEEGIRKPMFPEAIAVSLIDNLDAATNHARDYVAKVGNEEGSNWTKFCQLTGRQYFNPGLEIT